MSRVSKLVFLLIIAINILYKPVVADDSGLKLAAMIGRGTAENITWSPDGRYLAVAGSGGIWLYNKQFVLTRRLSSISITPSPITQSLEWSPNGDYLAGTTVGGVTVWDISSQEVIAQFPSDLVWGAWSPDSSKIALASVGGDVQLFDVHKQDLVLQFPQHAVNQTDGNMVSTILWSMNNQIASWQNRNLFIWSSITGEIEYLLSDVDIPTAWYDTERLIIDTKIVNIKTGLPVPNKAIPPYIAINQDYTKLVGLEWVLDDRMQYPRLFLMDVPSGTLDNVIDIPSAQFLYGRERLGYSAWSPDESLFVFNIVGSVLVWDIERNIITHQLQTHTGVVNDFSWSPDGNFLAGAYGFSDTPGDYRLRFWNNAGHMVQVCQPHTDAILGVDWRPNSQQVLTISNNLLFPDGTIQLVDMRDCSTVTVFEPPTTEDEYTNLPFFARWLDHDKAVVALRLSPSPLQLWDIATHQSLQQMTSFRLAAWKELAFADGMVAAITSDRTSIGVWLINPCCGSFSIYLGATIESLASDNSGTWLAIGFDSGDVQVQHIQDPSRKFLLHGFSAPIIALDFSPDSEHLAAIDSEGMVILWAIDTQLPTGVALLNHVSVNQHVKFNPKGTRVAANGGDGVVYIWEIQ